MYFDHKSYDFAEDIPHLILDGKRENIETVWIDKEGLTMTITTNDTEIGLGFTEDEENTSTEETEKEEEEGQAQTYRIAVTNVEYGFIDVVATSLDEAMKKVESFDGDYYVNKNTITNTELIEVLDK